MAGPRFLLVSGVRLHDQSQRPWPGHSAAEARSDTAVGGGASRGRWTAWRLLGRNNRELGRSSETYSTVPACLHAITRLQQSVTAAARLLSVDPEDGRWLWRLEVDGMPVAVSARSYQRQRECIYSLEQFLAAVDVAEGPTVRLELPAESDGGARASQAAVADLAEPVTPAAVEPAGPIPCDGSPHPPGTAAAVEPGPWRPLDWPPQQWPRLKPRAPGGIAS